MIDAQNMRASAAAVAVSESETTLSLQVLGPSPATVAIVWTAADGYAVGSATLQGSTEQVTWTDLVSFEAATVQTGDVWVAHLASPPTYVRLSVTEGA